MDNQPGTTDKVADLRCHTGKHRLAFQLVEGDAVDARGFFRDVAFRVDKQVQ